MSYVKNVWFNLNLILNNGKVGNKPQNKPRNTSCIYDDDEYEEDNYNFNIFLYSYTYIFPFKF